MSEAAPIATPERSPTERVLLQDWSPLARCLMWRVGRLAWLPRAADLFADEVVPHLVHDNGTVSQRTARLLFAWCQECQATGTLPAEIVICELGMGTGLHLKYALDAFQALCREAGTDWYGRLVALATDVSAQVARRAVERGLFADHAGHVRLGYLDVDQPQRFVELDSGTQLDLTGKVHMFIAFYVLDLLTVDVFRRLRQGEETRWEAVMARTWLRDPQQLAAWSDASVEELQRLAQDPQPPTLEPLAQAWTLLQQELRAWPVDLSEHPDLALLEQWADAQEQQLGLDHALLQEGTVVVHSAGALLAMLRLGAVLAEGGVVLLRDVALVTAEQAAQPRAHAHYAQVSASAVNLHAIDQFFAQGKAPLEMRLVAPSSDGIRGQATRLLHRGNVDATVSAFLQVFDGDSLDGAQRLFDQAKAQTDPVQVLEGLRQAIALEPTDWTLHWEAARVALERLGRADIAHVIALRAVELNPNYSPDLWCVLGDALHVLGRRDEAIAAFANGLATHPRHVRSLWSLAWVEAERGRHGQAFELLGQALRWDRAGQWRAEILQLLDVCLRAQALQWQAEQARLQEQDAL